MDNLLQFVRKMMLVGNGLAFLGFAIWTTVDIESCATMYGYTLNGVGGLNEFRAVYMGFWLGLTVLFFQALRHYRLAILGDLAFMLVLFQALARLYSFAVDGIPPFHFVFFFIIEITSTVIGLLIRPHQAPSS